MVLEAWWECRGNIQAVHLSACSLPHPGVLRGAGAERHQHSGTSLRAALQAVPAQPPQSGGTPRKVGERESRCSPTAPVLGTSPGWGLLWEPPSLPGVGRALSLAGRPQLSRPHCRALGAEESAWGEDEEVADHDYYNSIPGKEPPPGGLIDSRLRHGTILGHVRTQPSGSGPPSQVSPWGRCQSCCGGPRQAPT